MRIFAQWCAGCAVGGFFFGAMRNEIELAIWVLAGFSILAMIAFEIADQTDRFDG